MDLYTKWLIDDLKALPKDREELTTDLDPLFRVWKQRSVADRERLLNQLDIKERIIIERLIINGDKAAAIAADIGLTVRLVYEKKEEAIEKLLMLRHGAGYRP